MIADPQRQIQKTIVLIGLIGAGKTSVGRKLAKLLNMDFYDVDKEISEAAGASIEDIFDKYGEAAFRDVEERVMARLLKDNIRVLATGGGAILSPKTRKLIKERSISVWLRADLDILVRRTSNRENRPLLRDKDHRVILKELSDERNPIYAEADITVDTHENSPEITASDIKLALLKFHPNKSG